MAFPKKKARYITVNGVKLSWLCVQEITLDVPEGIIPNEEGILPPLDSQEDWYGYEDVYGYNSKATLYILNEAENIKVRLDFDVRPFSNISYLNKKEVRFLQITPSIVKKCVEHLNKEGKWINGNIIPRAWMICLDELESQIN